MNFNTEFFDCVLSDWNYKEVYVNQVCIYSVTSDVSVTIKDFKEKLDELLKIVSVKLESVNITPFDTTDGVAIKFNIKVEFWK